MNPVLKSALLGIVIALGAPSVASAQSTAGSIVGDASTGETVVVNSDELGFHREIHIKKDGKYTLRRVPLGTYTVQVLDNAGKPVKTRTITVQGGGSARVQ